MPLKWPRKTLKKIFLKITKNMKLSGFFIDLRGLNYQSFQRFEATFQQSVFPNLQLGFSIVQLSIVLFSFFLTRLVLNAYIKSSCIYNCAGLQMQLTCNYLSDQVQQTNKSVSNSKQQLLVTMLLYLGIIKLLL